MPAGPEEVETTPSQDGADVSPASVPTLPRLVAAATSRVRHPRSAVVLRIAAELECPSSCSVRAHVRVEGQWREFALDSTGRGQWSAEVSIERPTSGAVAWYVDAAVGSAHVAYGSEAAPRNLVVR